MLPQYVKELIKQGDNLFSKRTGLVSFWQEAADNFYPERADFTANKNIGQDFAAHLTTSYPIMVRRDLGNMFSTMQRPRDEEWFAIRAWHDDKEKQQEKQWLEWAGKVQRRAMYDPVTNFVRATKECDHDYATFGNGVISTEMNRQDMALLYGCWHLRDVVWIENSRRQICMIQRKWKCSAKEMNETFKGNVHQKVKDQLAKDPYCEFDVRHIVIMADDHDDSRKFKTPWVSIYVDADNDFLLEETGSWTRIYTIPRWQTVSGSQYAYSPAVVAGLPDSRLLQSITLSIMEASELATRPALVATTDAIKSDVNLFSGGVTWVDKQYDERRGDPLRPIDMDYSGIPMGLQLAQDVKGSMMEAFFLNKINLPPPEKDMTAFEVSQRIQEYIRNAAPLFEPMEQDYNAEICEQSFDLLLHNGAFGSVYDMPEALRGQEVRFTFTNPLHEALEKKKAQIFAEMKAVIAEASAFDPAAMQMLDARTALRDVLNAIKVPAGWLRTEDYMDEVDAQAKEQQAVQNALQTMGQGAEVAKQVGDAGVAIQQMQGAIA